MARIADELMYDGVRFYFISVNGNSRMYEALDELHQMRIYTTATPRNGTLTANINGRNVQFDAFSGYVLGDD